MVSQFKHSIDDSTIFWASVLLLVWGLISYLLAIRETGIVNSIDPTSSFGLLPNLGIFFFISLVLITTSLLLQVSQKRELYFVLSLIVLALVLWGTPLLVEQNPGSADAWVYGFLTQYFQQFGLTAQANPSFEYLGFPGSFGFFSSLLSISGMDILTFLKTVPFILIPATVFLVYCLFSSLIRNKEIVRLSAVIFVLANVYLHFHLCPEAVGLLLLLTALILLCGLHPRKSKLPITSLFIVIAVTLAVTHPTNMQMLIMILFFVAISFYVFEKRTAGTYANLRMARTYANLLLISVFSFLLWFACESYTWFTTIISVDLLPIMGQPASVSTAGPTASVSTAGGIMGQTASVSTASPILPPILSLPHDIRTFAFIIGLALSAAYIGYCFYKKKNPHILFAILAGSGFFFAVDSFFPLAVSDRAFQIAFLAISVSVSSVLLTNRLALKQYRPVFIALPILFLITTSTIYMYEFQEIQPQNLIDGYSFAAAHSQPANFTVVQVYLITTEVLMANQTTYNQSQNFPDAWTSLTYVQNGRISSLPRLIGLTPRSELEASLNGYGIQYNDLMHTVIDSNSANKIYDAPYITFYELN
jgi:hypothetical protein